MPNVRDYAQVYLIDPLKFIMRDFGFYKAIFKIIKCIVKGPVFEIGDR